VNLVAILLIFLVCSDIIVLLVPFWYLKRTRVVGNLPKSGIPVQ